ncbi:MAG: efflux RND transporter periplasmic adaptor subunit [Cyanobacteria bacterium P01_D01_bin.14]
MTQSFSESDLSESGSPERAEAVQRYEITPTASKAGPLSGRKGLFLGLVIGLLVALVGGRFTPQSRPEAEAPTEAATAAAASVTTQRAQQAAVNRTLTTTGTVQPFDLLQVKPQASGLQIIDLRVREGDSVSQGQVLAVLDDVVLQAQLQEARANQAQAQVAQQQAVLAQNEASLAEAEESFQNYQNLFERGAISQEQLTSRRTQVLTAREGRAVAIANIQSAQATVDSRRADIARLRAQLDQAIVRAPASGTIAERLATVGDTASTGTALYTLIQDDLLELEVQLPQAQLTQVSLGAPVEMTSAADTSLNLQGSIRAIDPLVDPQTRQATVNISLSGSDQLRTGMFLQADIVTGQTEAVVIPAESLVPQSDDSFIVYSVLPDNAVQATPVEVGKRIAADGDQPARVEIRSGLTAADTVVVEGASYLQSGDTVNVVESIFND